MKIVLFSFFLLLTTTSNKPKLSKYIARIAVIQAVYQHSITKTDLQKIAQQFIEHFFPIEDMYINIHIAFFKKLISHIEKPSNIEQLINKNLPSENALNLINPIVKHILKVATTEMAFESTAAAIIINEFVEISKEFVDIKATKFINAILDKTFKQIEKQCL